MLKDFENSYQVLAFDIETSGSSMRDNGIVSIGASLQDEQSTELDCFQINLSLPLGRDYDKNCLTQFWLKHPKAHQFVQTNCYPPTEAMPLLHEFLNRVEIQYPDVIFVSDVPSFDIAWLNLYLNLYSQRLPLNYINNTYRYRYIWDLGSMQKTLIAATSGAFVHNKYIAANLGFKSKWPYDHNPLNDARTIADFFNQTVKKIQALYNNQ